MSYNVNLVPNIAPQGTVMQYTGITDPSGWVICDGQARSNASGTYNNLINSGYLNQNSYSNLIGVQVDTLSSYLGAGLSFIAISGDGTTLLLNGKYLTINACKSYSFLYSPYNIIPSGFNPNSCAISYTGNVIVMNGYQSTTQGSTWNTNICSSFCAVNGSGSTILIDSGTSTYIMLSTNYGQTYTQISGLSTGPYSSNGLPTTTATVYGVCMSSSASIMATVMGASYTLYFSTNYGANWSNVGNINAPTYLYMSAIGNLIAYKNSGTLYISVNNGSNWNSYSAGASNYTYPISGDGTKIITGYYYYTYAGSGNWNQYSLTQTTSMGDYLFWNPPTAAAAKQDFSAIYQSSTYNGGNLLVSYNFCKQWYSAGGFSQTKFLQSTQFSNNSISTSYNGQIVLACQTFHISNTNIRSTIAKSTDGGNNWSRINFNPSAGYSVDYCGMSGNGNVMLWSWSFGGGNLFMSTDSGNTITNLGGGGAGCIKLNYTGSVIYTISRISTNMGATWITSGIPNFNNMAMSYSGSTIIASSAAVFYLSTNYGLNYTQISGTSSVNASNGLPTTNYNTTLSVAISDDGNKMLAGIFGNNIYLSVNAGTSWTTLSGPSGTIGSLPTIVQNWWSVAMSGDATKMLASADTNIYFSQNSGNTWTNVVTSAQPYSGLISASFRCYAVNISGDGSTFIALGANGVNYGINISNNGTLWYNPAASGNSGYGLPANSILGTTSTTWQTYSSSGNGIYTLAGNGSSYLYLSNDGGYGFMALSANGNLTGTKNWKGSSISTSGQYMLAVAYGESIYYSNTYGSYWYQISGLSSNPYFTTSGLPTSNSNWNTCAMDGTGAVMLAGINSGSLYLSTSSATYWTTISGAANTFGLPTVASAWSTCAISANATYMLAGINTGSIYLSSNSGTNWSTIGGVANSFGLPTVASAWSTVSINSSGSIMLAGINGGSLFLSTNSGSYWTTIAGTTNTLGLPTSAGAWTCSAINSSGTTMSAAINAGSLYISINSGKSWNTSNPFLATSGKWQTMAMNSSGNYITAAEYGGYVYNINTGILPTSTYTPLQITGTTSTDGTTLKYIMKY
jgi:hypothetical protein